MPNTETNKKHDIIVERLKKELIQTGLYSDFSINKKSGYDISCVEKESRRVLYFTVLLYGNRLYDATTLEEWEIASNNENNYFFVAGVEQNGEVVFYYFPPSAFIFTCSVPKFKIRSSLRKRDIKKYKTIKDISSIDELQGIISPSKRRTAVQLTKPALEKLSKFWDEL